MRCLGVYLIDFLMFISSGTMPNMQARVVFDIPAGVSTKFSRPTKYQHLGSLQCGRWCVSLGPACCMATSALHLARSEPAGMMSRCALITPRSSQLEWRSNLPPQKVISQLFALARVIWCDWWTYIRVCTLDGHSWLQVIDQRNGFKHRREGPRTLCAGFFDADPSKTNHPGTQCA
ncbi:hypothetical protein GQ53DRAFT_506519 [Thozetella sp. PMI_491]|nr:hypothetical protein GQ53DRAFT_506519 [Thozetella sp. PMI_491]